MKKILIIFLVIINSLLIFGQENKEKILTFNEYMEIINEKIPELKQNEINLKLAENNLFKEYSLHDVTLRGSFAGIGQKTYPDGSSTEIWYSSGFKGEGSVSTKLPSGTEITLGTEYTQMYSTGYVTDFFTDDDTEFFVTTRDPVIKLGIKQPLLWNWFGFLDRYAKKNAKMQLLIEELVKEQSDSEVLNYYRKLYFLWYQWGQILEYLETTIDNAKRLEAQTGQKLRSGIAENDEYQRARYSVFKYEEQYKRNELEYKSLVNELSIFFDAGSMKPEITSLDDYPFYKQAIESNIEFVDFENTLASKTINLNKDNLEYLRKNKFNQVFPQLNLFGNMDIKFHEYYNHSYDPEKQNLSNEKYDFYAGNIDFTAGIEFIYPLGNFRARGELKESELMLKNIVLEYDKTKNKYIKDLNNTITNIIILKDILNKKNQNLESLNSRIRTERIKYAQARQIELSNLIETENLITSEQIELMKTKANIIILYLDYLKLIQ